MKLKQTWNLPRLSGIVSHVIGHQPKFIQPDVDQEDRDKSSEVEEVLLYGNASA